MQTGRLLSLLQLRQTPRPGCVRITSIILGLKLEIGLGMGAHRAHAGPTPSGNRMGTPTDQKRAAAKPQLSHALRAGKPPAGQRSIILGLKLEIGLGMGAHGAHAGLTPSGNRMGTPYRLKEGCGKTAALSRAPRGEAPGGTALNNSWPEARNRPGDERTRGTRRTHPIRRPDGDPRTD